MACLSSKLLFVCYRVNRQNAEYVPSWPWLTSKTCIYSMFVPDVAPAPFSPPSPSSLVGAHRNLLGWAPPRLAGRSGQWAVGGGWVDLELEALRLCFARLWLMQLASLEPPRTYQRQLRPSTPCRNHSLSLHHQNPKHRPCSDCRRRPSPDPALCHLIPDDTPQSITQPALPHAIRRPAKPPPSRQNIWLLCLCRPFLF